MFSAWRSRINIRSAYAKAALRFSAALRLCVKAFAIELTDLQPTCRLFHQRFDERGIHRLPAAHLDRFAFRRAVRLEQSVRRIEVRRVENREAHPALRRAKHSGVFAMLQEVRLA